MRRLFSVLVVLLLLACTLAEARRHRRAVALTVRSFTSGRDLWKSYVFCGLTAEQVRHRTRADFVRPLAFIDRRRVLGGYQFKPIDYHVQDGRTVVGSFFPSQKVAASFSDGRFEIFRNYWESLGWGQPLAAASLKTIPPEPKARRWRQFWAKKGDQFFWVMLKGTRWTCQKVARQWGFAAMAHADGGSSLAQGAHHASWACVFKDELIAPKRTVLILRLDRTNSAAP